jgi:hypothetical protein
MIRTATPLVLLCVGLSGALYAEWRAPGFVPGTEVPEPAPRARPALSRTPSDAPVRTEALVATILARPLFSPTRRPSVSTAAPPKKPVAPRLAGVMVSAGGALAIFSEQPDKTILARAGDRVGPYLVRGVAAGEVTVQGPSGTQILHPTFASSGARPAPVPAGSAATAGERNSRLPSPEFMQQWIDQQLKGHR